MGITSLTNVRVETAIYRPTNGRLQGRGRVVWQIAFAHRLLKLSITAAQILQANARLPEKIYFWQVLTRIFEDIRLLLVESLLIVDFSAFFFQ